jgi:hypothetical protein
METGTRLRYEGAVALGAAATHSAAGPPVPVVGWPLI